MKTSRINQWIGSRTAVAGAILGGTAAMAGCTADMGTLSPADMAGTQMSAISTPGWTATWGTSPQASGQAFSANTTLRQTVHSSISGSSMRLQLSNVFGTQSVTFSDVHVATPTDNSGGTVNTGTDKQVLFGGQTSVTVAAGQTVASDSVAYAVNALQDVTVSFYLPNATGPSTYNWLSSQNNYSYTGGDVSRNASMPGGTATQGQYYFLMGMDVQNSAATGAVATFGASITNGYQSPTNTNQRWPDDLAVRIHNAGLTVGVLNAGISGNELLVSNSFGPSQSALTRFSRDVQNQSGIKWVVFSDDPINDVGNNSNVTGASLITGYQTIISDAHNAGMKIICSTLTPFKGAGGWTTNGETARGQVNAFVRGSGSGCDAVLDQDNATHDPNNTQAFLPAYDSGDHLHPNAAGYQAIANAFPLSILGGGGGGGGGVGNCAVGHTVSLKANANGLFCSAQSGTGEIDCNRTSVGAWEQYDIVDAGGGWVGLKAHTNNLYVSADLNNANKLVRAGWATTIGSWEMFQIVDAGGGLVAFKANANGNYVSSDMNITNQPLVAQWNAIGSWEKYTCQ